MSNSTFVCPPVCLPLTSEPQVRGQVICFYVCQVQLSDASFSPCDVRTSGRQDIRTSGLQDIRTSGHQNIRTPGRQDAKTPGHQDTRTSGRQDTRTRRLQDTSLVFHLSGRISVLPSAAWGQTVCVCFRVETVSEVV